MKLCTFLKPESDYPMDDLQQKIMEIVLNLNEDIDGMENLSEILFKISDRAFPYATEKELEDFSKVQAALRCMTFAISQNKEGFEAFVLEHENYKELNHVP